MIINNILLIKPGKEKTVTWLYIDFDVPMIN